MDGKRKVWVDGCFDMFHYGHANALRQARALGDYLVVGVHSDADILHHKGGPCVIPEQDRYAAVRACRYVDEVVEAAPYVTDLQLMTKYGCEICVHGDDTVTSREGEDVYSKVKEAGRYVEVPRTRAVSTTDLLRRILTGERVLNTGVSCAKLSLFANTNPNNLNNHLNDDKVNQKTIVYVDGTFDLLHIGHVEFLRHAKSMGDHLIVGVHNDTGSIPAVMTMEERALGLLACRYVDDVILDAPLVLTDDFLKKHNVTLVVVGRVFEYNKQPDYTKVTCKVRIIDHPKAYVTIDTILQTVLSRRREYELRNKQKALKDAAMISRGFV